MEEKKKNKNKNRLFILIVLAILLFSIVVGFVYSKYLPEIEGTGKLSVAKWFFSINNIDILSGNQLGEINLGKSKYSASTISDKKIAPGTSGSFDIVINATGTEVAIDYSINVANVENKPKNLYFVVDGTKFSTLEEMCETLKGRINANDTNKVITKTINWSWDYETEVSVDGTRKGIKTNDKQDTLDGNSANDFTFTLNVKGVQVEPKL